MGTYPQGELQTRQWWSDGNHNTDKDRQNNKEQNKRREWKETKHKQNHKVRMNYERVALRET